MASEASTAPDPFARRRFRRVWEINTREFAESAASIGSYNPGSRFLEALTAGPDPVRISP